MVSLPYSAPHCLLYATGSFLAQGFHSIHINLFFGCMHMCHEDKINIKYQPKESKTASNIHFVQVGWALNALNSNLCACQLCSVLLGFIQVKHQSPVHPVRLGKCSSWMHQSTCRVKLYVPPSFDNDIASQVQLDFALNCHSSLGPGCSIFPCCTHITMLPSTIVMKHKQLDFLCAETNILSDLGWRFGKWWCICHGRYMGASGWLQGATILSKCHLASSFEFWLLLNLDFAICAGWEMPCIERCWTVSSLACHGFERLASIFYQCMVQRWRIWCWSQDMFIFQRSYTWQTCHEQAGKYNWSEPCDWQWHWGWLGTGFFHPYWRISVEYVGALCLDCWEEWHQKYLEVVPKRRLGIHSSEQTIPYNVF